MGSRILLGVVLVGALALGGWYFSQRGSADQEPPLTNPLGGSQSETRETYASTTQSLSFTYPDKYSLEENAQNSRHSITLIEKSNLPAPQNGEGPVAITIDIFTADQQTLRAWIEGAQESNFQLSPDDLLSSTTVGGTEGLSYRWSGLYEGESVAVLRGGRIYVFSSTWMSANDEIRNDFRDLLETVTFAWD